MKSKGKKKLTPKSQPAKQQPDAAPEEHAAEVKPVAPPTVHAEAQSFSIKPGKPERNAVILVLAITLVVYLNSLGGDFV